jgi:ABC-type nitrate/sulfonate/bicarbonate transport system permease component
VRYSLWFGVAGAVIGDSVGASSGVGLYIARSQRGFRYDQVFAGIAVVVVVSMVLFSLVWLLSRLTCPWLHLSDHRRT